MAAEVRKTVVAGTARRQRAEKRKLDVRRLQMCAVAILGERYPLRGPPVVTDSAKPFHRWSEQHPTATECSRKFTNAAQRKVLL